MAVHTQKLFQYLTMTFVQEQLAIRYLQSGDEKDLHNIGITEFRDKKRGEFAWRFEEEFKKTYKKDPTFFRLFYELLGERLFNVMLVRSKQMDFVEMKDYVEKSSLSLDGLVAVACKHMTKLSGDVNEADKFLRKVIKENPQYMEERLQTLDGTQKLLLLLLMLETDYERFSSYGSVVEEELQEHADYIFRLQGGEEKIEAIKQYVSGESDEMIAVGSTLPDFAWWLLFRVYPHSSTARRYIQLLAKQSVKTFIGYALDDIEGKVNKVTYYRKPRVKQTYEEVFALCKQFDVPEERLFAYSLANHNVEYGDVEKIYEYQLLFRLIDEDPEFVQRTLQYLSKTHYIYVSMLLAEKGHSLHKARVQQEFMTVAFRWKAPAIRSDYQSYLVGELSLEEMIALLEEPKFGHGNWTAPEFETALLWNVEEIAKRAAVLGIAFKEGNDSLYDLLKQCTFRNLPLEQVIEDLLTYGVTKEKLVYCAASQLPDYGKPCVAVKEAFIRIIVQERELVMKTFADHSVENRLFLLEELAKDDAVATREVLIQSLGDSSKKVRALAVELLAKDMEAAEEVAKELTNKKKIVREQVMQILLYYKSDMYMQMVKDALEEKKNASLIEKFIPVLGSIDLEEGTGSVEAICARILTPQKRSAFVDWLGFEPQVRLSDSEKVADVMLPLAYFQQYVMDKVMEKKEAAEAIRATLNEHDLKEHVQAMYQLWLSQGADTKKRGILALYGIHSDDEMALSLKKQIDEWALDMRGALAAVAVQALALSPSRLALMTINAMAFKYKHKQVRSAAKEALSLAATVRGITEEELEDQLIPDLGFNKRGEKTINYGSRVFTAYVAPSLKIELKTEEGKIIKTLPKPNAKDDAEKAEVAKAELSAIKKQLRSIISMQTDRLEMALSLNRYWSQQTWESLFVENPIMQQFAISLIWGEYNEGKLVATFRYMDDGTFNTIDEEEHELTEGTVIGLVHPLELTEEERDMWKEQLEDYEIVQSFPQMTRDVFHVEEGETIDVERFAGFRLNGRSLFGKMTKYGWSRGSVQDAGIYTTFYKEDLRTGVGAELVFEGAPVGYEQEEDVTLFEIQFYQAGTINRGAYEYDEIDHARRIVPKNVPARFFSEMLYDMSRVTDSIVDRDEQWRNKR